MLHATFGVSNLAGANPTYSSCLLLPPSIGTIHHYSDPLELCSVHGHLLSSDQPVLQAGWVSQPTGHQSLPSSPSLESFSLPSFDVLYWKLNWLKLVGYRNRLEKTDGINVRVLLSSLGYSQRFQQQVLSLGCRQFPWQQGIGDLTFIQQNPKHV